MIGGGLGHGGLELGSNGVTVGLGSLESGVDFLHALLGGGAGGGVEGLEVGGFRASNF